MNWIKRLSIVGVIICLGLMITAGGCKKNSDAQLVPTGILLQYNGCKQFLDNASGQFDGFAPGQQDDCIEYQYSETGALTLRHINGGFSCDPGEITADIVFNGNQITITEKESQFSADCLCLFDLDYKLVNLPPGEYTLQIIELYVDPGDQTLELTLQLFSTTSGSHCVQRTYYPWI
jgi:hypothetical protein